MQLISAANEGQEILFSLQYPDTFKSQLPAVSNVQMYGLNVH